MIRRYDMRRSDNSQFVGTLHYPCSGSGEIRIHTGFPVRSAIVTPVDVPLGGRVWIDIGSFDDKGFTVVYENIPPDIGYVEFSYMAS